MATHMTLGVEQKRLALGMIAAFVLHVVGVGMVSMRAREIAPMPTESRATLLSQELTEIALEQDAPGVREERSVSGRAGPSSPERSRASSRPTKEMGGPGARDANVAATDEGIESPDVSATGNVTFGGSANVDLGIGSANPFLPRGVSTEGNEGGASASVRGVLRDAARAERQEIGLGPEGPVLAALVEGTSRSLAPVRGHAVFVATAAPDGTIVDLDVLDTDGDRPGWKDAARTALASLAGKKLHLPPGTKGATMRIRVQSGWKLPNGADPGTTVTLFGGIPLSKGEGKDSAEVSILDPIPKIRTSYVEIDAHTKIPVPTIELDLLRLPSDPSNIGAKPRRIVHAHVDDVKYM